MDHFKAILSWSNIPVLLGLWILYYAAVAVYNISPLHPLYRFPGPKVAAMSYFYEAYFDWWLVGRYGRRIRQMHEKYGKLLFPLIYLFTRTKDGAYTQQVQLSG